MTPAIFAFPGNAALADRLRSALSADEGRVNWRRFPDGESLVALDGACAGRDVILVCTLREPDITALPLLFAARTLREFGARSIGLVAPYLAYMRQDARFHPGEAISSRHFSAFVSWTFDWLVTVDPHLHRYHDLAEIYTIPAEHVSAMPLIADWIRGAVPNPVLVGPDGESAQWVRPLAELIGAPSTVLSKQRSGDRDVEVSAPERAAIGTRAPVLIDDIVSSGHTMLETLARLHALGAAPATCIAVHGVFAENADRRLIEAGAARVVSTNTIEHASNAIDVTPVLLPAVRRALARIAPDAG